MRPGTGRAAAARRMGTALLVGAAALLPSACIRSLLNVGKVIEGVAADSVALNVVLIGDAGLPAPGGEPVMQALRREIAGNPQRTIVVYLGDNIYPRGMVDSTETERRENERILDAQLAPLLETGTRGIFVPGNHDWAAGAPQGWQAMRRQAAYVGARGGDLVRVVPQGGCPGPVVLDFDDYLRLIVLDTQWWLHGEGPALKPYGRTSPCRSRTEEDVVDSLRVDLATAGTRRTVVVAHHPLVSGGEHGGYFDWPTYLFPLHPVARLGGIFARQDVSGREYRNMARHLERAFAAAPPLVYASGHEHNLQVFQERSIARHLLVSGGGIYNHTTPVRAITGSQYTRRAAGYMTLTFLYDGRVRLSVHVVDAAGQSTEDYSAWLETARIQRPPAAGTAAPAAVPAPP
ncbi:MAG TPA: metallophosphoesterase [Longimicrobiaceae bacterium]|nr:metallophosphoesterase [Longimicrobiaceae bacterium]